MKPADEIRPVKVALNGVFTAYSPNKGLHHVLLLETVGLFYKKLQNSDRFCNTEIEVNQFVDPAKYANYNCLLACDIVGCQCMRDPPHPSTLDGGDNDNDLVNGNGILSNRGISCGTTSRRAYFCVYSYPICKVNVFGGGQRRQRLSLTFTVNLHDTFIENLAVAELWRDTIRCYSHGPISGDMPSPVEFLLNMAPTTSTGIGIDSSSSTSLDLKIPCQVCQNGRKLLILVNPHSGPGKAAKIFQERVVPLLAEAGVSYDLVITSRPKEAQDIVREANLNDWHGIVIVSGDGLIFEVINGLMERPDWSSAIQKPLGIIPGGSGNALAKTISHASREPLKTNSKLLAAFNVAKGKATPMDVIRVTTTTGTLYSFLSIGWGIIADIDIESERLRALGESRFTIWALARIMDLRVYKGRLSYIPISRPSEDSHNGSLNIAVQSSQILVSGVDSSLPTPSTSSLSADKSSAENMKSVETNNFRKGNNLGSNHHNGCSSINSDQTICSNSSSDQLHKSLLPQLDESLPDSWVKGDEEDFVLVYVSFQSHISSTLLVAPDAQLDDGLMWMMILRKGVTRAQLISFMLALDTGSHTSLPFVEMKPVRAFRLEPISAGGYLTVDGEVIEYGPVQAEMLRGVARVMTH